MEIVFVRDCQNKCFSILLGGGPHEHTSQWVFLQIDSERFVKINPVALISKCLLKVVTDSRKP